MESGPSNTTQSSGPRRRLYNDHSSDEEDSPQEAPQEDLSDALTDPTAESTVVVKTTEVKDLKVGEYVLVKFVAATGKKEPTFFIGQLKTPAEGDRWEIRFYRKCDVPLSATRSVEDATGTSGIKLVAFKEPSVCDAWVTEVADMVLKPNIETVGKNIIVFRDIFGKRMVR